MKLLVGALFLSIWQSILFWGQDLGISAILFAVPLVYITIDLLKGHVTNKKALLISIPIILLSSTYFIFNNPVFSTINFIIIPILYIVMIVTATSSKKSIIYKIILMIIEPLNYFGEVFREILDKLLPKEKIEKEEQHEKHNVVKAIFFTGLILIIVLPLLISADSEFAKLFGTLINGIEEFSMPELICRIIIIIFLFFYMAGFFINMLSKDNGLNEFEESETKQKESFTIHTMLTVLNIIYLLFCLVQIKSLFTIENIKYSSYARQGFFQLMIVSLINIIMILKATRKELVETEKQVRYKKFMCIAMLIFTFIIILSSFARMTLYQQQYGDTRLRILVDFTLITEIILLVPTAIYIVKSNINLTKSYFIIIVTMYCIINFVNIDNMIAKNNIDRYIETGEIDLTYLTYKLNSTDTIEQLERLRETEFKYSKTYDSLYEYEDQSQNQKDQLNKFLINKKAELNENLTWSEFNFSKWRASRILNNVNFID